ncbi:MAG: hypothetical protein QXQ39_01910 [Conexivisphaerales archaeon]
MLQTQGKWVSRFIWTGIVQGAIAVVATALIVDPLNLYYSPAKVIASGGAGTWLFVGYVLFLVVGVIATPVTAMIYYYIENVQGKVYRGFSSYLAWAHLLIMTISVDVSMFLMMWGGYMAGWAAAPVNQGGGGYTALQIHEKILGQLVDPIGLFALLAAFGALLGGIGYIAREKQR